MLSTQEETLRTYASAFVTVSGQTGSQIEEVDQDRCDCRFKLVGELEENVFRITGRYSRKETDSSA